MDADGTLTTYDSSGTVIGEIETGVEETLGSTMDPATGKIALTAAGGLSIADPKTGDVDPVPYEG